MRGNDSKRQRSIGLASSRRMRRGFTLIELLVVIAIIAILAAIIYPVFSSIRENSRESNTMSHMHDVSAALALYHLDNHKYPPVLFAYACDANAKALDGCNVNDTMASIAGDASAKNELAGLYPEYVHDWHSFTCLNDPVDDPNGTYQTGSTSSGSSRQPQPNYIQSNGVLMAADGDTNGLAPYRSFFTADAFDLNPQVAGTNQLASGSFHNYNYIIRYQTAWTSWDEAYDPSTSTNANFTNSPVAGTAPFEDTSYARQLCWQNPPANTFVTGITDHVQNANKILVLYVDGSVHKANMQLGTWTAGGWDETEADIAPNGADSTTNPTPVVATTNGQTPKSNYVPTSFWQYDYTK